MKNSIYVLLWVFCFQWTQAQSYSYDKKWEEIERMELKSLPKTTLEKVNEVYLQAKKQNNQNQLIKALFYKSKIAITLEENATLKIINQLKKEAKTKNIESQSILYSVLADLHWQYYQQNRYRFYSRSKTDEKIDKTDFRTWDLQTLFEEVHFYYQKSIQAKNLLQKVNLEDYNYILHERENSKIYRPTLYDFLAHRALDFYKTEEYNLDQPSYKFEIENEKLIGDNTTFLAQKISSKDSLSVALQSLKIYRELTSFHLKDKKKDALVDLTLKRLDYVKNKAVFKNKKDLYLESLKQLEAKYKSLEASADVSYKIAVIYRAMANEYPYQKKNRFKNKEVLAIINRLKEKFPEARATKNAQILEQEVQRELLDIQLEKNVPIQELSKIKIKYKNIGKLFFTLYKITEKQEEKLYDTWGKEDKIKLIQKFTEVKKWNLNLIDKGDYQTHSIEAVVPKINNGKYIIVAKTKEDLNHNQSFATGVFQATNIALINLSNDTKNTFQVVDRRNGKPIIGAKVTFKSNRHHRRKSTHKKSVSGQKGILNLELEDYYYNVNTYIETLDEKAFFKNDYLKNKKEKEEKEKEDYIVKSHLFMDRSIYRPGQILYFKGILTKHKENHSSVVTKEEVELNLYDANDQLVKEMTLKTNEYGSFSGQFILPNNGLTGNYYIEVDEGLVDSDFYDNQVEDFYDKEFYFLVEEYKRPTFKAKFQEVKESYTLNDSIKVKGSAMAFAGATISDAQVKYRVYRTAEFPSWGYYRRPSYYSGNQEIINGETTTNKKGEFEITFQAIPDLKVDKKDKPVFSYKVSAEVIDISGETKTTETTVNIGYHSAQAYISSPSEVNQLSSKSNFFVRTENLNGQFVSLDGKLTIYKLSGPKHVLRKRPWDAPDYKNIDSISYSNLFPYESYHEEESYQDWKKGEEVFSENISTKEGENIDFKTLKKWKIGKYIAVFEAKDKFKQKVETQKYFDVFNPNSKDVADNKILVAFLNKDVYDTGEEVILNIGSASENAWVLVEVEKNHKVVDQKVIALSKEIKEIKIPVNKEDVGGFYIRYHLVNYNSFQENRIRVNVPYYNESISIETLSFRDKLSPGEEETWSFKIKGRNKDKVNAEVLVSMYDRSLDEFKTHNWYFSPTNRRSYYSNNRMNSKSFGSKWGHNYTKKYKNLSYNSSYYDNLNYFGFNFQGNQRQYLKALEGKAAGLEVKKMKSSSPVVIRGYSSIKTDEIKEDSEALEEVVYTGLGYSKETKELASVTTRKDSLQVDENPKQSDLSGVKIRKDLKETAFFFPHLKTDKNGDVSFSFNSPERLTQWKLQLLAHTPELKTDKKELKVVTQKELMITPNAPRFLRQGDEISFSAKISNLSEEKLEGIVQLQLYDALTDKLINAKLSNQNPEQNFKVDAKGNVNTLWKLKVPFDVQAVKYQVIAKAGNYADGEQNVLPVLSNRTLVTESMPMWINGNQSKTFTLEKLKNNQSKSLKHHKLSLEITSNPIWYAVQALPYLMEYPYECSEQTFARYYANTLATHIANVNPRIQEVFNLWKNSDALLSNLEKNQELKSIIIQETPWLRDAQSEREQKKRIALLFDLNKMKNNQANTLSKLEGMQMSDGAFPWFKGGRYPNRYITQHITQGFGHLNHLGLKTKSKMIQKAVRYLDQEIVKDYKDLLKYAKRSKDKEYLEKVGISNFTIQYLYMRSFYKDVSINSNLKKAKAFYTQKAYDKWTAKNLNAQAMISLIAHRNKQENISSDILKSLKENSITSQEMGMYWKANTSSYSWYQAPVETQALMIEAFSEIQKDIPTVENLQKWLLKNKQTNRWGTTKATTEAIYALLVQGKDKLKNSEMVEVTIANKTIDPLNDPETKIEAGTGYFKKTWTNTEITKDMATVKLHKTSDGIAWGALYWQYFEDLDKITTAETPLKLKKKLFKRTFGDKGEVIRLIKDNTQLKLGDLVRVRIELSVDREMEFVHMKDMRASGLEPINVLSTYKYQDGLAYYEATKDASTNFFFDKLNKGIYVFEYDLRVNNIGDFSNGITTIQAMYAPEFSSHSEGKRIRIK